MAKHYHYDGSGRIVFRCSPIQKGQNLLKDWTIREIRSKNDAQAEDERMSLSVEWYIEFGKGAIFSLRDPNNSPHVAIEILPGGKLGQIAGKRMGALKPEYQAMIDEWLRSIRAAR